MPEPRFIVARNPEPDSSLPYLLRLPLDAGIVLKAGDRWPRTAKVYCHPLEAWPDEPEVLEDVPVRSCIRRGAAIDLVLDRPRENRSQFVFTRIRGGREAIFWQTPRTARRSRPQVRVPGRRASGLRDLVIAVDTRERYPYRFARQQAETERRALPVGDYAVFAGDLLLAAVERKGFDDLAGSLVDGSLQFVLADLAALPRAGVVVEAPYSELFKHEHVAGGRLADLLARVQVRHPRVPVLFLGTRPLAEEWTFRFLGAALALHLDGGDGPLPAGVD